MNFRNSERYTRPLKTKDEVAECIRLYTLWFFNQRGRHISTFHSDGDLEFNNGSVRQTLQNIGADHVMSTPYTPQQNGISERSNRTLMDLVRTLFISTNLPKGLWAECLNYVTQILNAVSIHKELLISPYEIMYGRRPYLGKIHPFGTKCIYYESQGKLKPRGKDGVLVGLSDGIDEFRIWIPGTT